MCEILLFDLPRTGLIKAFGTWVAAVMMKSSKCIQVRSPTINLLVRMSASEIISPSCRRLQNFDHQISNTHPVDKC